MAYANAHDSFSQQETHPSKVFSFSPLTQYMPVHYDKVDETGLRPLEAVWKTAGVWLRVEPGRAPADYDLRGSFARGAVGDSGVLIQDADYLVIEDLVAEGFPNDGFNVHGSCHGLVFRGITARWNGDDGFSVHEDVQAGVYNAHFHHNDYGIQDVGASQTSFFGCLVETNRLCGVDLYGGMRILYDTIVRGNGGGQVRVRTNLAANLGFARENPMFSAQSYLKRVSIGCGSGEGLLVGANCRACAVDCTISGVDVGVRVDGGELHLVKSEVSDCRRRVLDTAKAKSFMTNSCAIAIGP